jgi:hypothetical protein
MTPKKKEEETTMSELEEKTMVFLDGNIEEEERNMVNYMLEQHRKFPESKRISKGLSEMIKKTRNVVILSEEEEDYIRGYANRLDDMMLEIPNVVIPRLRTFDNIIKNVREAYKKSKVV